MIVSMHGSGTTLAGSQTVAIYTVPIGRNLYVTYGKIECAQSGVAPPNSASIFFQSAGGGTAIRACVALGEQGAEFQAGDLRSAVCFPAGSVVNFAYNAWGAGFNYSWDLQGVLI